MDATTLWTFVFVAGSFALYIGIALFVNLFLGGASHPLFFFLQQCIGFVHLAQFVQVRHPRHDTRQLCVGIAAQLPRRAHRLSGL